MAYINPVLGEKILVKIGDGATPTEAFAADNLINTSRGVTISTSTESDELIDLADQSAPAQTIRRVRTTDVKIDGAGMIHADDTFMWIEWATEGTIKNCQVTDGNWLGVGPFVLTSFQVSGDRLKSSTCQITLEQAGAIAWSEVP